MRIVFTGYADIKAVIDAINQGRIFRYITKPWDPDELRAVLHQACEEHDQVIERQRLLTDLRSHVAQGLALVQGLQEGTYGTCHPAGQTAAAQFAEAGNAFLERLDRALKAV
jgi:DNA-binding NtrC family response regulator